MGENNIYITKYICMFINVLLILEKEIYNFNHKIGDTMATAQKIIKSNNRIDVIETTYNNSFKNVINRNGRPKRDFELMSDTAFKKCKYEKINLLKKYNRKLDFIINHNRFNYFITIRGINSESLKKFLDRVRKNDKELRYLTLASWSKNLNMHYHILFYTKLSYEELERKMKNIIDYKIIDIYYQRGLLKYFKKNINYDTIYILKQNSEKNSELRDKQIEILKYGKLININKKVNKEIEIRKPSIEQINQIKKNNKLITSFNYKLLSSNVNVKRYIIPVVY